MKPLCEYRLLVLALMLVLRFELKNKLNRGQWEKVFSKDTSTK